MRLAVLLLERRNLCSLLGGAFFCLKPLDFPALRGGLLYLQSRRFALLLGDELGFLPGLLRTTFIFGL
ncbi:MAG: hypothetical protein ACRECU_13155 [Methylocella sp.]